MESEEGNAEPPPPSEEAPPPEQEEAPPPPPPPPEGTAPSEEQAPPPEGDGAPPPTGEEVQPGAEGEAPLPEGADLPVQGPAPSVSDYRSLIPSDEEIIMPDDDESGQGRVRARLAPRPVQSVLSDGLSQSSRRSSKFRRSMSGIPNLQETLKEKQVCS